MTKTELINAVADATGQTKKLTDEMVMATFNVITDALADEDDGSVFVKDFGKFEVKQKEARSARNPRTGEEIEVPAHGVVKFKAAKFLKEAVY